MANNRSVEDVPVDDGSWRHSNLGRIMANALNRFERRVLEILAESGHIEVRYSHINLTRNLDIHGTITPNLRGGPA